MESRYVTFDDSFSRTVEKNCLVDVNSGTHFLTDIFPIKESDNPNKTQSLKIIINRVPCFPSTAASRRAVAINGYTCILDIQKNKKKKDTAYKPYSFKAEDAEVSSANEHTSNQEIIEHYISVLNVSYKQELYERLLFLDSPNDDPDDSPMLPGSLKYFLTFIKAHKPVFPDIFLTPDGHVRSEWFQDRKHYFFAEFLPSGFVRYSCGIQSEKDKYEVERNQGRISIDKLIHTIKSTNSAAWCLSGQYSR